MLYGLTPSQKKYQMASRYFAMGFISIGVFSFIAVLLPIEGLWGQAFKLTVSNTYTFVGMYFFRMGFAKRSDHPIINKKLFLAHFSIYAITSFALSSDELLGDRPTIRVALLNLNFIMILVSMFPVIKVDRIGRASFGERVIYATILLSILMMLFYPFARGKTESATSYLLLVTPIQALQIHTWIAGLLVLLLSDVIDIYRALAIKDGMTDLFNRTYFMKHMRETLASVESGSLILCDLDHFKRINDTYDHSAGDKALKEFSELLKTIEKQPNTVSRFGGEEFAIFLPEANSSEAEAVANDLKEKTENLFIKHEHQIFQFTASFGVYSIPHQEAISDALQSADKALYSAKHSGRNTVCVYN